MALNADAHFTSVRLCLCRNCNFVESNTDSDSLEKALNNLFLILWKAFCTDAGRFIIYTPRDVSKPGALNGIPCVQPFSYANNFFDATWRAFDFNVLQYLFPRSPLCAGHFEIGREDDTKSLSYWRPIFFLFHPIFYVVPIFFCSWLFWLWSNLPFTATPHRPEIVCLGDSHAPNTENLEKSTENPIHYLWL